MQSCAACCCWRGQRPPSGASLGRRPTRPPKVGGSRLLQAAPAGAEPGCALHLFLGAHPQPLALRGFQVHRGMTSEGRSLHLARPDPIQLDQHAARRTWHPAAPRRERMERARVAEDRSMQRAAKDPSSTTWPFTLARTTPRNKMTRSWPPSPHEGSTSTQLKLGTFGPAEGSI